MLLMFCARLATLQVKGTLPIWKRTLLHSSFIGQEYQMSYTGAQAKTNNALQQKIGLTCVISSIHASFLSMTLCSGDVNLQFLVIHPLSCKFPVKWIIVGGKDALQRQCITYLSYIQLYHQVQGSVEGQILSRRHLLLKTTHKRIIKDQNQEHRNAGGWELTQFSRYIPSLKQEDQKSDRY